MTDPTITILKRLKKCLRCFTARHTIAVTRPLVLRLLLRDYAQAAGVWKTVADHTSLSTSLVLNTMDLPSKHHYCLQNIQRYTGPHSFSSVD